MDGPDAPSLPVHGDEFKLKQILINLLSNAVKFTESGSILLKWTIEKSKHYRFEVIDTGQGIPANMRNRIFEPFQQASNNEKREGPGLGLAITRKQIELMGGSLALKSAVGEGSRFVFAVQLPPAIGEIVPKVLLGSGVSRLATGQQVKALVADDDTTNRNVLSEILQSVGVETFVAENGRDAVNRVRTHHPDIVFMDMRMPVMNGIEAIKEINRGFPDGQIKTVAISASALNDERKGFISVGCNDFISKPVQMGQVLACITRLLHVDFEYKEPNPNQFTHGAPAQVSQIHIPGNLYARLKEAARLHNISDLKDCLAETIALGENGRSLLKHL
ncbi:MAG: ATP-binding protein, partial [Planctomycetota bacterium]|nr:ATP-binding protein [Planctomycetota bacterium]